MVPLQFAHGLNNNIPEKICIRRAQTMIWNRDVHFNRLPTDKNSDRQSVQSVKRFKVTFFFFFSVIYQNILKGLLHG